MSTVALNLETDDAVLPEGEREFLAGVASGCIAQNGYLACAAFGLGTVLRGLVDRRTLAHALGLASTQRITLAQSVGVPLS